MSPAHVSICHDVFPLQVDDSDEYNLVPSCAACVEGFYGKCMCIIVTCLKSAVVPEHFIVTVDFPMIFSISTRKLETMLLVQKNRKTRHTPVPESYHSPSRREALKYYVEIWIAQL